MSVTWQPTYQRPEIWMAPASSTEQRIKAEAIRQGYYGITVREIAQRFDMNPFRVAQIMTELVLSSQLTIREDAQRGFVYLDPIYVNGEAQ